MSKSQQPGQDQHEESLHHPHRHQQQESTAEMPLSPTPMSPCTRTTCSRHSNGGRDMDAMDDDVKIDYPFHLRAAIAINNMGVSLLERGHFCTAMKTFKDALSVMKMLNKGTSTTTTTTPTTTITTTCEEDDEEEENENDDQNKDTDTTTGHKKNKNKKHDTLSVQDLVQLASVRLATKCIPKKTPCKRSSKSRSRSSSSNKCPPTVDIRALDDSDISAIRSAIRYGPSVSMAFPIRCTFLEDCQQQEPSSGNRNSNHHVTMMDVAQQQYYTAMIRYNHGLAHLLAYAPTCHMASDLSSCSRKLLSSAFKHLSQANSLLLPNIQAACTDMRQKSSTSSTQQQEQQPEGSATTTRGSSSSSDGDDSAENNTLRDHDDDDDDETEQQPSSDEVGHDETHNTATLDASSDSNDGDQDTRFFSNLLLFGLVLMSLHTFFRHKENRQDEAHHVLESLMNLEDAIQEHDVMEQTTHHGHSRNADGASSSSSSSSSFPLLCDTVQGASAA